MEVNHSGATVHAYIKVFVSVSEVCEHGRTGYFECENPVSRGSLEYVSIRPEIDQSTKGDLQLNPAGGDYAQFVPGADKYAA